MLHWKFLLPNQSGAIAVHQKVFFNAWLQQPIYLHTPLLLCQCLYWYGFKAWQLSFKISCKRDFSVKKNHNLTRLQCLYYLLYFTLGYNLSPNDVLRHKLYNNRKSVFDRLYSFEGPILHELNNRGFKGVKQAKQLLSDKLAFAKALKKINIPCIATEKFIAPQYNNVFIKPNVANCSQDAGALTYDQQTKQCQLHMIQGADILDQVKIKQRLQQWIDSQQFIIQPLLLNHPELLKQFNNEDLITFRLITMKSPHSTSMPLYLKIEIPLSEKAENHRQYYQVYAIDLQSYALSSINPNNKKDKPPQLSAHFIKLVKRAIDYCTTTHDQLFDCYAVGFDFCITPDGPVIIEGNYGWDVSAIQYQEIFPCNL